jgi:hypothetical protein
VRAGFRPGEVEGSFRGTSPFLRADEGCGEGLVVEVFGSRVGRGDVDSSRTELSLPLCCVVDLLGSVGETMWDGYFPRYFRCGRV